MTVVMADDGRTIKYRKEDMPEDEKGREEKPAERGKAGERLSREGRRLPEEMYNFYNMDQYMTSGSHDQASHKDFDIWLNDFEKQVGAGYW